jgi:hypothetical protein
VGCSERALLSFRHSLRQIDRPTSDRHASRRHCLALRLSPRAIAPPPSCCNSSACCLSQINVVVHHCRLFWSRICSHISSLVQQMIVHLGLGASQIPQNARAHRIVAQQRVRVRTHKLTTMSTTAFGHATPSPPPCSDGATDVETDPQFAHTRNKSSVATQSQTVLALAPVLRPSFQHKQSFGENR